MKITTTITNNKTQFFDDHVKHSLIPSNVHHIFFCSFFAWVLINQSTHYTITHNISQIHCILIHNQSTKWHDCRLPDPGGAHFADWAEKYVDGQISASTQWYILAYSQKKDVSAENRKVFGRIQTWDLTSWLYVLNAHSYIVFLTKVHFKHYKLLARWTKN